MAALASHLAERRREHRSPGGAYWQTLAVLRPGQPVTLLNISSRGALVESASRLRPGARTEVLLLAGSRSRTSVGGRLERCYVAALEPIRYRGVVLFDARLDLDDPVP